MTGREAPTNCDRFRILLVDDERMARVALLRQLLQGGYVASAVDSAQGALQELESGAWDVVVSDIRMPGMDGLELLRVVRTQFPGVDVILITAYGSVEAAVSAMQEGAADYLTKPFRFQELAVRLQKLRELRAARNELSSLRALLNGATITGGLVGRSPLMSRVYERIQTFAGSAVPALITGETGTGKELVSRALHMQGDRAKGPFIGLSCGSIPRDVAESELFGHEKGSFTNAIQRRQGAFERAHKGTLLLDDVDDLPLEIQVKLLRVLQEQVLTRVGGTEEVPVDVRIVATTKQDLEGLVAQRLFRDDLFYRLRGLEIHLPPLRERGDDVILLAQHFLDLLAAREKVAPKHLASDASELLLRHSWPGNVRELRRAIESAFVLCPGAEVTTPFLPEYLRQLDLPEAASMALFTSHLDRVQSLDFSKQVERFERTLIQWAMTNSGGNKSKAAAALNLARTTLLSKLDRSRQI